MQICTISCTTSFCEGVVYQKPESDEEWEAERVGVCSVVSLRIAEGVAATRGAGTRRGTGTQISRRGHKLEI